MPIWGLCRARVNPRKWARGVVCAAQRVRQPGRPRPGRGLRRMRQEGAAQCAPRPCSHLGRQQGGVALLPLPDERRGETKLASLEHSEERCDWGTEEVAAIEMALEEPAAAVALLRDLGGAGVPSSIIPHGMLDDGRVETCLGHPAHATLAGQELVPG